MKEDEYRTIDYSGRWYAEKLRSPGVWKVLGVYATKEEAAKHVIVRSRPADIAPQSHGNQMELREAYDFSGRPLD